MQDDATSRLAEFFGLGPIAQRLEQRTFTGRRRGNAALVRCNFGERPVRIGERPNAEPSPRRREGVETIITHLIRQRNGEGMVQTTHGLTPAAKAEVVSIILWFWVRIPVGPPIQPSPRRICPTGANATTTSRFVSGYFITVCPSKTARVHGS